MSDVVVVLPMRENLPDIYGGGSSSSQLPTSLPDKIRSLLRIDQETGCWLYIGKRWSRNGYGRVWWGKAERQIHRVVWSILRGPICFFFELDHECRNRACANPAHLAPVFPVVNTRRGRATLFKKPEEYHGE